MVGGFSNSMMGEGGWMDAWKHLRVGVHALMFTGAIPVLLAKVKFGVWR